MRRLAVLAALCLCLPAAVSDRPTTKTHKVALNGHTFTLPVGFTIELAAKTPLVDRPIVADLDDHGRLFVADSSGSNEKVEEQLKKKPHRIVRLEDTDGDGVYDKQVVYADRMMFPEGVMCRGEEVFVAAPPSIWKLSDPDKNGVSQKRVEWFEGKTLTGCANDLHGPFAGLDGWIYWCKGAFAEQRYARPGKKDFVTKASHIFRARPDGSGIEPVMTGGMDNPVDVVFLPSGERIFTTTFFQHPGGGLRDGLIHAVVGGVWGKDHHVVHDHPWTSPELMPVLAHMGPAAPAGLHRYESSAFGDEYRDTLFAVQFNLAKVSRHVLTPSGATYKSRDEDFLVSDNRDFHPTDVIEDADGSLLVIDTGGWYKLCCPTSQLSKPDVLGAIYRVRRTGAPKLDDTRGSKIAWAKLDAKRLAALLGDDRPVVRRRAIESLAAKGADAVGALIELIRGAKSVEARRNAVWAATRIDHADARAAVRLALNDADESVRQAALQSVSLWRDRDASDALVKLLGGKSAHNARGAAESLGRIGDAKAVPALLDALSQPNDRFLEHSLIYALIEINNRAATGKGLEHSSAKVRRAALIALDGMEDGKLESAAVLKQIDSPDAATKATAWWIAGRHPEWGEALAGHFRKRLDRVKDLSEGERGELVERLTRFTPSAVIASLLAARLGESDSVSEKQLLLRAMAGGRFKEKDLPAKWLDALRTVLGGSDAELTREALRTARALPIGSKLTPRLVEMANDEKRPVETRIAAIAAVPGTIASLDAGLFALLSKCVDKERAVSERGPAAHVISRSRLSSEQLLAMTEVIKSAGPMEMEPLLEPFTKGKDEKVGLKLVAALEASEVRGSLHIDRLRARLATYPASVKEKGEALITALDADRETRRKQLDDVLALVKKGDVRRGQAVFNAQKGACASCHAIGYLGGKIGPDLTTIGKVRDERDLLESILFPSVSFVRSYEPVQVTTKKGQSYNGLIKSETSDEIVLTINATEEMRLRREDVEEVQPSKVSIMPAGLEKVLTAQELADLVAFLRACR